MIKLRTRADDDRGSQGSELEHFCSDRSVRRKILGPRYFAARYMPAVGQTEREGIHNGVGSNNLGSGEGHRC